MPPQVTDLSAKEFRFDMCAFYEWVAYLRYDAVIEKYACTASAVS
jgi:hypothetical protein